MLTCCKKVTTNRGQTQIQMCIIVAIFFCHGSRSFLLFYANLLAQWKLDHYLMNFLVIYLTNLISKPLLLACSPRFKVTFRLLWFIDEKIARIRTTQWADLVNYGPIGASISYSIAATSILSLSVWVHHVKKVFCPCRSNKDFAHCHKKSMKVWCGDEACT
jgi:hypothetical protein